jgi:hypothetical protein
MMSERKHNDHGKILLLVTFLVIQMLFITGCGYRVTPGGEYIDNSVQTVFVDTFGNRTSEANIENSFRSAFIGQLSRGSRLKPVGSRETADAVFKGRIESILTTPLSYNRNNLAAEERMTLTMELILEEKVTGKIIWEDKGFSATQDYPFNDIITRDRNRKAALIKLLSDSAEKAYRSMMSGF